jgi:hypothetical protein
MYTVEYRRFYLRDLESIVIWPSRLWALRFVIPVLLVVLGIGLWQWVNLTPGAIFGGLGVSWLALELVLGPTAEARIRTTGVTVDLPLVKRMRRARKVLAKIDEAARAVRAVTEHPTSAMNSPQAAEPSAPTSSEAAPVTQAPVTQTNGS